MTAEIIQFMPKADPKRMTDEEITAALFMKMIIEARTPADCGNLGWPWSEDKV